MRSPLAYTPRRGPLRDASALAVVLYFGSFAVIAFSFTNPIVLAGTAAGVVVAGLAAGAAAALWVAVRYGIALGVVFVIVNAVAAQRGETILLRGWDLPVLGQVDVSAEALAEGAVLAGRLVVVLMAFAVMSASVDPDRLLRMLRPVARRSALTAVLVTRLVPLAARDHTRLREAAALRGPAAASVGRAVVLRRLVAGSLDRAVDVAATLELRGYALGAPRRGEPRRPGRRSWRFAAVGALLIAIAVAASVAGIAELDPYPSLRLDADPATLLFAAAIPMLAAVPFAISPFGLALARRPAHA